MIEGLMVDFFDHDDQEAVNLVHRVVKTAAQCHLTVTLSFLGKGRFAQKSWTDGATPTDLKIEKGNAGGSVMLNLSAAGGAAMRFTPRP